MSGRACVNFWSCKVCQPTASCGCWFAAKLRLARQAYQRSTRLDGSVSYSKTHMTWETAHPAISLDLHVPPAASGHLAHPRTSAWKAASQCQPTSFNPQTASISASRSDGSGSPARNDGWKTPFVHKHRIESLTYWIVFGPRAASQPADQSTATMHSLSTKQF